MYFSLKHYIIPTVLDSKGLGKVGSNFATAGNRRDVESIMGNKGNLLSGNSINRS